MFKSSDKNSNSKPEVKADLKKHQEGGDKLMQAKIKRALNPTNEPILNLEYFNPYLKAHYNKSSTVHYN
jgi:hypothetical protein